MWEPSLFSYVSKHKYLKIYKNVKLVKNKGLFGGMGGMEQRFMWSRLTSNLLLSWGCPWTANPPVSNSYKVWITCICQYAQFIAMLKIEPRAFVCANYSPSHGLSPSMTWKIKFSHYLCAFSGFWCISGSVGTLYVLQTQAYYFFFEPTSFGRHRCRETKNGKIMPYIHLRGKNSICLSKHKERTILTASDACNHFPY